jgi:hypothetical protein
MRTTYRLPVEELVAGINLPELSWPCGNDVAEICGLIGNIMEMNCMLLKPKAGGMRLTLQPGKGLKKGVLSIFLLFLS